MLSKHGCLVVAEFHGQGESKSSRSWRSLVSVCVGQCSASMLFAFVTTSRIDLASYAALSMLPSSALLDKLTTTTTEQRVVDWHAGTQ